MGDIFGELVKKRGISEEFLHPNYDEAGDPFELPQMREAVDRLKKAVKNKEKVVIFGDYDVDGVTASVVMYDTLKMIGIQDVKIMLPDRFTDGYGMSERLIDKVGEGGISLVVTVDCGSNNQKIIEQLGKKGVDTIVTDHHECGAKLPPAIAVVNPKAVVNLEKTGNGWENLAGVGVAFELARALMLSDMLPKGQEKWLLDLVVIGTLCDAMKITRENRILTYWGMKVLAKTRRPGLKELMRLAKVGKINAEAIGFRIGPRLNAAGRIKTANAALKLLMTPDAASAAKLAMELEELNTQRRNFQMQAMAEIKEKGLPEDQVLVVEGEWPEGVLGIIAGRLVEQYKRPAFVFAISNGVWKGSGRSFGEFNLAEALKACKDCIIGGGGHAEACGLKVESAALDDFRQAVNNYYASLKLQKQEVFLRRQEDLAMQELKGFNMDLLNKMAELEPFGDGNREPYFRLNEMTVAETRRIGAEGKHLSMMLEGADGGKLRLVAWGAPEQWCCLQAGCKVDALVKVMENEFRGVKNVEGELLELQARF